MVVELVVVGVFDFGVGGFSVLCEICVCLLFELLFYVVDNVYVFYGEKSVEYICECCEWIGDFFLEQGVKVLVLVCNIVMVVVVVELCECYLQVLLVVMEFVVKLVVVVICNGWVGVLVIIGILKSVCFVVLFDCFVSDVQVFIQFCLGLVECIEVGDFYGL